MANNYGVKKASNKTYVLGTPGQLAFAGQPYIPARTAVTYEEQRVFKGAPSFKYVPIADVLAGKF